jgi:hypothetical protein
VSFGCVSEAMAIISELVRASTVASLPESIRCLREMLALLANQITRWAYAGTISRTERCSAMMQIEFESGESWSVSYRGLVYDDARKIDGVWYYRDPATKLILRFALQDNVVPIQTNVGSGDA